MATLNLQVSASSDDANEGASGSMSIVATVSTIAAAGAWVGARFLNVTIPPGSTITAASMQWNFNSTAADDPNFNIFGEDHDNPGTFTTTNNDISNRTRTTANSPWSGTAVGTGFVTTSDISTVIQEIVDRAGWASGNAMVMILDANSGVNAALRFFDAAAGDAPKLDITYTPPATTFIPWRTQWWRRLSLIRR